MHRTCLALLSRSFLSIISCLLFGAALNAQEYTTLYSFQGRADGSGPIGFMIVDKTGKLYGTTTYGGAGTTCDPFGCGTVFEILRPAKQGDPWTEAILHNFNTSDGNWPSAGHLVGDKAGNLYGTTQYGGVSGWGTIFELVKPETPERAWSETILYNFTDGNDGGVPATSVAMDADGNLYGVTYDGGRYGAHKGSGTIFQLAPPRAKDGAWIETTLYSFQHILDGNEPSSLTLDAEGNLYGTRDADHILCTPSSPKHCGTAYELQRHGTRWRMKVLHEFEGSRDGAAPSEMIFDYKGNLYGTTMGFGGDISTAGGTVFELSPPASGSGPWTESLLYTFSGGADGSQPLAAPIFDRRGNLFGTTFNGGTQGYGVVFKLTPPSQQGLPWIETVLHSFVGGSDGADPFAGLLWGTDSALYGTASGGGGSSSCSGGCGTVFRVVP